MENLPWYVAAMFVITFVLTIWLFSKATHYSKSFLVLLLSLAVVQSLLGLAGSYNDIHTGSNRFPLLIFPLLVFCIALFFTGKGKAFIDALDIKTLTILHVIRILVEVVLFWLYIYKAIPKAMTFEGRNLDILSGLTAPLIYYFGFVKRRISRTILIIWNVACMVLLVNVASTAMFSLPARFERFGFEQPNIAVGYFPYLLLPAILVPLVLFANAAAIRQLVLNKSFALKN